MNSILNITDKIKRRKYKLKQGEKAITVVQRNKKGCMQVCYAKGYSECRQKTPVFHSRRKRYHSKGLRNITGTVGEENELL